MSELADNLKSQMKIFGFSEEEAEVYIYVLKARKVSALKLSRDLKIARTKIYRLTDKLIEKGFLIEVVEGYGKKFRAETPEKFLHIVDEKESNLKVLKNAAPAIVNYLNNLIPVLDSETKILHYRGIEGLKQVTWNTLKTKDTFRIYEIQLMHSFLDYEFSEKVRSEYGKKNNLKFYQLTNSTSFEDYTNQKEHVRQWNVRHIPKEELEISIEVQIYNDVYCMYDYKDDDVFIVEIYNKKLAEMQKKIFDLIWKGAQKMEIVSEKGKARLKS